MKVFEEATKVKEEAVLRYDSFVAFKTLSYEISYDIHLLYFILLLTKLNSLVLGILGNQ